MPRVEANAMTEQLLAQLEAAVGDLPFPASKDEILERLAAVGVDEQLRWLARAMPGLTFQFRSDVASTARVALEMDIQRPWPDHAAPRDYVSDDSLPDLIRQRLALSRETNANLIRVEARQGVVTLDGRSPDVPSGVMATRVALALVPSRQVVNRLDVQA